MADGTIDNFGSQPWYRKVAMIMLLPFVLPTVPLVLLILACIGLFAAAANYFFERRVRWRMRHCGRYLTLSDARERIALRGGTLIIENPSLGWNFTRAWWTPDDVLSTLPFAVPTKDDYKNAVTEMKCLEWDKWCWDNYTSLDDGRALLLRVWNDASIEQKLKRWFADLHVVHTWTALVHVQKPPENPNASVS